MGARPDTWAAGAIEANTGSRRLLAPELAEFIQLADRLRAHVVGVTVQLRWGNATIKGKVTGLDVEQGRVVLLDNFKGKGSRGRVVEPYI